MAEPIYRNLGLRVAVFTEALEIEPESFTLLWRLRDDYDEYPGGETWGNLEVHVPTATDSARLTFTERWPGDLLPVLSWDRTGPDTFVYASLAPDATDQVAIIDQPLQQWISELV